MKTLEYPIIVIEQTHRLGDTVWYAESSECFLDAVDAETRFGGWEDPFWENRHASTQEREQSALSYLASDLRSLQVLSVEDARALYTELSSIGQEWPELLEVVVTLEP